MLIIANIISAFTLGIAIGITAMGLSLIFGVMEILNFAHGAFIMLSAYLTFWLWKIGISPFFSFVFIVPILLVIGYVIYWVLIEKTVEDPMITSEGRMMWILIMTFAVALFIQNGIDVAYTPVPKSISETFVSGIGVNIAGGILPLSRILVGILAFAFFLIFYYFLNKTRLGRSIRATGQNRDLAEMMGVDVCRTCRVTFAISAALAACGGCLMAIMYTLYPTIGNEWVMLTFIIVVLGGLGSIRGALLGGIILMLARSTFNFYLPAEWGPGVGYVIVLFVFFLLPRGLLGRK